MKKVARIILLTLIFSISIWSLSSCRNYDPFPRAKKADLVAKYNLSVSTHFYGEQPKIFVTHQGELNIEMSVRFQPYCSCSTTVKKFIETEKKQLNSDFYVRTFVSATDLWFYDVEYETFQPAMWVSIKIGNEKQTIYFEYKYE